MKKQNSFIRTVEDFGEHVPLPYLGNGLLGYRIKPNPFTTIDALASGYTRLDERGHFETWADAPYPLAMDFRLNDSASMMENSDSVRVKSQSLDMSCGELTTEMEFPMGGGTASCTVIQFISRTCPTLVCQEVRIRVPEDGNLTAISSITNTPDSTPTRDMIPAFHERNTDISCGYTADGTSRCGVSVRITFNVDDVIRGPWNQEMPHPGRTFNLQVSEGQEVIIRTLASTISTEYHHQPELESCRLVNMGATIGFDKLREANRQAWSELWKSRVKVTGDERAQEYLDCSLFYLYSHAHPSLRTSIPSFGPSHKAYHGHIFWDTETYMMPALLITCPEAARATLDFRVRHLEAAKKRANAYGFSGAMYPWEQDNAGFECTPSNCNTGWLEQHVNMCVSIAVWQYAQATGDRDWLINSAWPIIRNVADWVVGRVEKTERGYEFRTVTSAAEGFCISNSSYVNALCAEALRIAGKCAAELGFTPDRRWKTVAEGMFIPRGPVPGSDSDEEVIYMHEGGFEKLATTDSVIIGFPFDLPFEIDVLRRTFEHCMTLEIGGLNMGHAFFVAEAAFIGDRRYARHWLDRVINDMWEKTWGMGTEFTSATETCFVTTMGAMLQTAMMAFTGLRFEPGNWTKYTACLPENWEKIEVDRIYLGGECYSLVARNGEKAQLTRITSVE